MKIRISTPFSIRLSMLLLIITGLLLPACSGTSAAQSAGKLSVVATTTIVADVVQNVGGSHITLTTLIPPNVDEHGYQPTPQDIAKVAQAGVVFENGLGLEQFIDKLMQNASGRARLVAVSEGIQPLQGPAEDTAQAGSSNAAPVAGDPHVWTDPNNVLVWVNNIQKALSAADPTNAQDYQKNADSYRQKLKDLDGWVQNQVKQIPENRRELVTDHLVFTYFASRYGFTQVGAVVPGYSTLSSPSAQELAALEDHIRKLGVPVIFVGNTVSTALSERVAQDTQTKLVHILTGSLTETSGPAPTYIDYIQYNVKTIVAALK